MRKSSGDANSSNGNSLPATADGAWAELRHLAENQFWPLLGGNISKRVG
jgi:hypothetical protein